MKNLQNKNIIIFGATSYIGHELSTILAKKGVNLIIHGNSSKKLESLHHEISLESSKVISIKHNVLSEKFYLELFKTVSSKFNHLDVLINLIGKFDGLKSITDFSHRDWNDLMEINFSCYWRILKELSPLLGKNGKSKVLFLTNKKIESGKAYHNLLSISKSALSTMAKTINQEKKKLGIECSVIDIQQLNVGVTSLVRGDKKHIKKNLQHTIEKIIKEFDFISNK